MTIAVVAKKNQTTEDLDQDCSKQDKLKIMTSRNILNLTASSKTYSRILLQKTKRTKIKVQKLNSLNHQKIIVYHLSRAIQNFDFKNKYFKLLMPF